MVQRGRLGKAVSLAWNFPASAPRLSVPFPGIFGDDQESGQRCPGCGYSAVNAQ